MSLVRRSVTVVVALALLAGCSHGDDRLEDAPAPTATPYLGDCIPTGSLETIDQVNRFITRVRGDESFAGGDVGASVQLQDGRSLYVFGDTLRGPAGRRSLVRNSMLMFSPGCGRVVAAPAGGAVVPDREDGVGYWPMSIARLQRSGYDEVGVGMQRVRTTGGNGAFAFEVLGPAVAKFTVRRGGAPQLESVTDVGPDDADTTRPMWGASALVDGGWIYLYGTARPPEATFTGFSLRVARSRVGDLADPGRWQYWTGERWSAEAASARPVIGDRNGVSQTLSVFRQGRTWYAVSKRNDVLGSELTIWSGPRPTGPFTAAPAAASIPSDAVTGTLRYMPLAHPDLLPVPGTVVVSYSENNTDFDQVLDDPRRYRPRFLRVTLPR